MSIWLTILLILPALVFMTHRLRYASYAVSVTLAIWDVLKIVFNGEPVYYYNPDAITVDHNVTLLILSTIETNAFNNWIDTRVSSRIVMSLFFLLGAFLYSALYFEIEPLALFFVYILLLGFVPLCAGWVMQRNKNLEN